MEFYTEALTNLIQEFERLPGIGKKTAERLAYYVLRASEDDAMKLARAIRDVKKNVRNCSVCFSITEREICQGIPAAEDFSNRAWHAQWE